MAQGAAKPVMKPQQHRNLSRGTNNAGDLLQQRSGKRATQNDEATVAYVKRILCSKPRNLDHPADSASHDVAEEPLHELLPPLTSSNAVDVQLYAFIAVILSNFVQTWYNRITPDQQFVGEIVSIIAHCTRGLEQRLRVVDLESLLLDELPELLGEHVNAVEISRTSRIARLTTDVKRSRFLALRPHMALTPVPLNGDAISEQKENEDAWCLLLVNRLLPLLLPPEDLQNPCLDVLVSEIFSEMIFRGGVLGKASEPWLIWDGVTKLLHAQSRSSQRIPSEASTTRLNRLEESGLLRSPPSPQKAYQHVRSHGRFDRILQSFWLVVQAVITIWTLLRASVMALMQASTIPARTIRASHTLKKTDRDNATQRPGTHLEALEKRPIISMHVWGCVSEVLSLNQRMPWLTGVLSLMQWLSLCGPGQLCRTNSRIDRLLSYQLNKALFSHANWLPPILQAARVALFPDNSLAAARIPPTSDEIVEIKRGCATAIVEAMPESLRTRFFATQDVDAMVHDMEARVLELLADQYMNKHLIVSVIELVVVRLFPGLAGDGSSGIAA